MKGIVEKFGGTWNGYTWLDQTTYLETAGKDALDTLLFIEAERMTNGLYEPSECESERTVIISSCRARERSRSAARHRSHGVGVPRASVRHPTIGWIDDCVR
jgi:zinc protease